MMIMIKNDGTKVQMDGILATLRFDDNYEIEYEYHLRIPS